MPAHHELAALIDVELDRPVHAAVSDVAAQLAARAGTATAAVVFYGSALRDQAFDGVLDFYVLVDRSSDWPGSRLAAFAGSVLPPNVGYAEFESEGWRVRVKFAVMTVAQFGAAMSRRCIDTTLWARFSQPCACVHSRSATDRRALNQAIVAAVVTASHWAADLGPPRGLPIDYWRALYQHTYAVERRVERTTRGVDLLAHDEARYARLLPLAWQAASIDFEASDDGRLEPRITSGQRAASERSWRLRRWLGRPLNLLRLLKAAPTFDNAMDYVAWKVERHSGYRIEPSEFQRRHPLLSAPGIYWRLRRRGVLR